MARGLLKLGALAALAFQALACAWAGQNKQQEKPRDEPIQAWWLTTTFTPSQTAYESLPIGQIDSNWVKMSVLSYASLPREATSDLGWMHRDGFVFQADNIFDRARMSDRELCGVFEDRAGRKGRFLLVLEKMGSGPWKVVFLHQASGEAGFNVLIHKAGALYWSFCMQCDDISRLRRKNGAFYLETEP